MNTYLRLSLCIVMMSWWSTQKCYSQPLRSEHPVNIIYILADDLGIGDVSSCNARSAWTTPHIDRIASEGMLFTDAHSGSAVCTPTRYGILTGNYAWRTRLKSGVLWSFDDPLISRNEMTVGTLLQEHRYTTACIGKWHLGLGWQRVTGYPDSIDYTRPIKGGPTEVGFDYFFGITASLDIPPYVYIENQYVTRVPDHYTENTSEMGWWRRGPTSPDFKHEEVLPLLTGKALAFIEKMATEKAGQPFFLYFALPSPHTPILPAPQFQGSSKTNPYGDFVLQVDWTVGQILNMLDDYQLSQHTLLIFTSDNGCSPEADFESLASYGHDPSAGFRGAKADIFEGGHRIPFLARWPGKIEEGSISSQVICLTDLISTVAAILDHPLPMDAGVDSYNLLPALLNKQEEPIREATVHHSVNGSFAIRQGDWKLILCPGSGGWSDPIPGSSETLTLPPYQLYNLSEDPGETINRYAEEPARSAAMLELMEKYQKQGRSTPQPGIAQK